MVEVERESKNYLLHGHHEDPRFSRVGALVVLGQGVPRGVMRSLLPPRIIKIDRLDFQAWSENKEAVKQRREELLKSRFEGLEVQLVRNGECFFSSASSADVDLGEDDFENSAAYFSLVSNERRVRVLQEFLKRKSMRFSEILEITGNPKLVKDCVDSLIQKGMLSHDDGHRYRMTAKGDAISTYLLVAIPAVKRFLEELQNLALDQSEDVELE